jgi:hypothetical protein
MIARRMCAFWLMLAFLVVLVRCASTSNDWKRAQQLDTVSGYDEFVSKHPDAEMAEHAKKRISELREEQARAEREFAERQQELLVENKQRIARIEAYTTRATTEESFLGDGWSAQEAAQGKIGIIAIKGGYAMVQYTLGFASPIDQGPDKWLQITFEAAILYMQGHPDEGVDFNTNRPFKQVCVITFEKGMLKSVRWVDRQLQ